MFSLLLLLQTTAPPQLTEFLQRSIGFDAQQLAAVERGEPVVKVLDTRDRRDVAVFGVITTPGGRGVALAPAFPRRGAPRGAVRSWKSSATPPQSRTWQQSRSTAATSRT